MKIIKEIYKGFQIKYLRPLQDSYWDADIVIYRYKGTRQEEYFAKSFYELYTRKVSEARKAVHEYIDNLKTIAWESNGLSQAKYLPNYKSVQVKEHARGSSRLSVDSHGKFKWKNKVGAIYGIPTKKFTYNIMYGVGKAKYLVTYYQGKQTHPDGSEFGDIKIFHNKKDLAKFEKELKEQGYVYG